MDKGRNHDKIRRKILVPLSVTFFFILGISVISVYWLQREHLEEDVLSSVQSISKFFKIKIEEDTEFIKSNLDFIVKEKSFQDHFLRKDRDGLLNEVEPLFNDLRSKYNITHFYFIDSDSVVFLRAHNPPRYDTPVTRFTMSETARRAEPFSGIELGRYGTFTLHVIYPWWINGKLEGYIELGQEIDHISMQLKQILSVELFFLIKKEFLDRDNWEEGLEMTQQTGDWDQFSQFVISSKTMDETPGRLEQYLKDLYIKSENQRILFSYKNVRYSGGFVPLSDVAGRFVGDIVVLKDITKGVSMLAKAAILMIAACLLLGGMLFFIFYFYIGRIEGRLLAARRAVEKEIEDRKQAQDRLVTLNAELEGRVQERTREIKKALDAVEEASRAKSDFLANMSHELRTPINVIMGMCHFFIKTELTVQQEWYLKKLNAAANSLKRIVDDILDFSKIEDGELDIKHLSFSLRGLLDNLKNTYIKEARRKGIELDFIIGPDVPLGLMGDSRRLRQILDNLLDNAVKFTPEGGITLTISPSGPRDRKDISPGQGNTAGTPGSWTRLLFEVTDTGIGMSEDEVSNLFQPFTQLDGSSTRKYGGIGLGLAFTKRLVEMMGGEIGVESQPGQGSTFYFTAVFGVSSERKAVYSREEGGRERGGWKPGMKQAYTSSNNKAPGEEMNRKGNMDDDVTKTARLLNDLAGLLRDDDTRAIRCLEEVLDDLKDFDSNMDISRLEQSVREYNFEEALKELDVIMTKLGTG